MSFFERLMDPFIDVIAWDQDRGDRIAHRFDNGGGEISHGAKLVVREGQAAVFVHEGKLADVFPPGVYKLRTANLPVLATLQHWDHGFESPFKSEIYFISTRRFTDLKWGTRHPVLLRDPEFGVVRLRAFGTYTMRVDEPGVFLREIVGAEGVIETETVSDQLRNVIAARFAAVVATAHIPVVDLAANMEDLGRFVLERIAGDIAALGVAIDALYVENVSLPPAVEQAIDRRSSIGVVGDLRKYARFQAEAARPAAAVAAPKPAPALWHAALDGAASGPFSSAQLAQLVAAGRLKRDSLVWRPGFETWAAAGEQAELAGLFPSAPPPLPSAE